MTEAVISLPPAQQPESAESSIIRLARPEVYYDVGRQCYWIKDSRGDWITVNETALKRQLRACGFGAKVDDGESLSKLDQCINAIQLRYNVAYAGPLAGHSKGMVEMFGHRILVTSSPKLIEPKQGEFPTINKMLHNMLGEEQLPYFLGWLKISWESLISGHHRPGQVPVLAGERDSGKSLLQNLLTVIFGGRPAKPYRYMSGKTEFNGDLFGAEHLMIEDEVPSTDIRSRRVFGARIKEFTVTEGRSCHAKYREAITLKPFWRVTISLNDEPENLMTLPVLDESDEDKIMLLKVYKADMPMRTFTDAERDAFWQKLVSELPAFLWFLMHWEIPDNLKCSRFGVKHFHHLELLEALDQLAPETSFLALIDRWFRTTNEVNFQASNPPVNSPSAFVGTAAELQSLLLDSLTLGHEARRLLTWAAAAGVYLGRLARKRPDRVRLERTATERRWRIEPPPGATKTILLMAQPDAVASPSEVMRA